MSSYRISRHVGFQQEGVEQGTYLPLTNDMRLPPLCTVAVAFPRLGVFVWPIILSF